MNRPEDLPEMVFGETRKFEGVSDQVDLTEAVASSRRFVAESAPSACLNFFVLGESASKKHFKN